MFLFSYLDLIFGSAVGLLGIFLLYVRFYDAKAKVFSVALFAISLWTISNALADFAGREWQVRLWSGLALIAIMALTATMLFFADLFLQAQVGWIKKLSYISPAVIVSLLAFTSLSTVAVFITAGKPAEIIIGPLYFPAALYFFTSFCFIAGRFIGTSRLSPFNEKVQLRLMAGSLLVVVTSCLLFDLILPLAGITNLFSAGPLSTVGIIAAVYLALFHYNFFNVIEGARKLATFFIVWIVSGAMFWIVLLVFRLTFHLSLYPGRTAFFAAILSLAVTLLAKMFNRRSAAIASRLFLGSGYDLDEATSRMTELLNSTLDRTAIETIATDFLKKYIGSSDVAVVPIIGEEKSDAQLFSPVDNTLQVLITTSRSRSILSVHEKSSGHPFSYKDILLAKACARQLAGVYERASMYERLKEYSLQLEEKVADRTAELKQSYENQKHALADIAHSLQTPLTLLKIELEGLTAAGHGAHKRSLGLQNDIEHLSAYIYDLLRLSRMENSEGQLSLEQVNLSELTADIAESFNVITRTEKISFELSLAPEVIVRGSRQWLREAIMTVLANAAKYLKKENRKVSLQLKEEHGEVIITIADTGRGMTEEESSRVFSRFYRASNGEKTKGTGLGLAIAKSVIEKHGGNISIESVVGEGTTVIMKIPDEENI